MVEFDEVFEIADNKGNTIGNSLKKNLGNTELRHF